MQSTGNVSQKAIDIIEISKKDEVYLKVTCEPGVAQELCDYFTFTVPGHTFMPAYRMKIWDGKIRLFNIHNRLLYSGLLEYVFIFAEKRNYQVITDGDWWKPLKIEKNEKFLSSLKFYCFYPSIVHRVLLILILWKVYFFYWVKVFSLKIYMFVLVKHEIETSSLERLLI